LPGGTLEFFFNRRHSREEARKKLPHDVDGLINALQLKDRWLVYVAAGLLIEKNAPVTNALPALINAADRVPGAIYALEPLSMAAPKAAAPILARSLDSHPKLETFFIRMLGTIGTNAMEVAPQLQARFENSPSSDKILLAESIWKISRNCEQTLPYLINALQNNLDPYTQTRIIAVLGAFGPKAEAAAPILFRMLESKTNAAESFRNGTIQALGKIGAMPDLVVPYIVARIPPSPHWADYSWAMVAIEALGGFGEPGIERLMDYYRSTNSVLRTAASSAIPRLGPRASLAIPYLIDDLHTTRPQRLIRACQVLSELGETAGPALPQLKVLLKYPDHRVRAEAALALHKLKTASEAITPVLLKILNEPSASTDLVETVSRALIRIASENPQLADELKKSENRVAASRLNERRKIFERYGMVDYL
jgi:HEAT repeat protein